MAASVRNLFVCADGTWASPQSRDRGVYAPSNVVKLVKALHHGRLGADSPCNAPDARPPNEPLVTEQVVFYDKGVGTGGFFDRLVGGATGEGLEQNVRDGYHFLVSTYQPGDRIFLTGFSRGAYTVRRLAGFLGRFGLLDRALFATQAELDAAVIALYARFQALVGEPAADAALPLPAAEQRLAVEIEALGVWDTVGALGLPEHPLLSLLLGWNGRRKHQFIDQKLSPKVRHAYHALALHEPRAAFAPSLWDYDEHRVAEGTLQQVWFAGAHSNVGGSYQEAGLSDVSLRWMLNRLRDLRVAFREGYLPSIQPDPWGEARNPREGLGRLLYPTTLRREPGEGTFLHPNLIDRNIPASLFGLTPESATHPIYTLEHGFYTNAAPVAPVASSERAASKAAPLPADKL